MPGKAISLGNLKDASDIKKLESMLEELYLLSGKPEITDTDPNGSVTADKGTILWFNDSSVLKQRVNTDGGTTWAEPTWVHAPDVLTTQGDVLYYGAAAYARLAAGTDKQTLRTGGTGANPSWESCAFAVLTTRGDILTRNGSALSRLAVGATNGMVLQSDGTDPSWTLLGGTPALTLGTANAAGSAITYLRTDDTILAFDATVPADLGTAAAGSATVAARRDHVHNLIKGDGCVLINYRNEVQTMSSTYATADSATFVKTSSLNTLEMSVHAIHSGTGSNAATRIECNGLTSDGTGTQTAYPAAPYDADLVTTTLDISSLTNGTEYTVNAQYAETGGGTASFYGFVVALRT